MLSPCQFTNFIAASASGTAKSLFAPAIGREPGVRIAARQNSPRNSPCSLPAPAAPGKLPRVKPGAAAVAAAVAGDRIGTDGGRCGASSRCRAVPAGRGRTAVLPGRRDGETFQRLNDFTGPLLRRGPVSGLPQPSPGGVAPVLRAWRRPWPRPGLWRRSRDRNGCLAACRR